MSGTNKQSQVLVLNLIEILGYREALLFTKKIIHLRSEKNLCPSDSAHTPSLVPGAKPPDDWDGQ